MGVGSRGQKKRLEPWRVGEGVRFALFGEDNRTGLGFTLESGRLSRPFTMDFLRLSMQRAAYNRMGEMEFCPFGEVYSLDRLLTPLQEERVLLHRQEMPPVSYRIASSAELELTVPSKVCREANALEKPNMQPKRPLLMYVLEQPKYRFAAKRQTD